MRDLLLAGETGDDAPAIHDWDICTSARPAELKRALAPRRTLDTGLKHGTLTVLMPDGRCEVTTYRIGGRYSDGRHPDSVSFTASLKEDLAHRDFTVNAMAMAPGGERTPPEVIDPFGDRDDLRRRILRGAAPGPEIGRRLRFALDAALDGHVENEREAQLAVACAGNATIGKS